MTILPAEDLLNLKDIGVDTNRVPLLAADRWLDADDFIRFTRLLEVLTFRWIVTNKGGQDMETAFRNLGETLDSTKGAGLNTAITSLTSQLPASRAFRDSFRSRRMGDPVLASYVLRKIENELVTPGTSWRSSLGQKSISSTSCLSHQRHSGLVASVAMSRTTKWSNAGGT